MVVMDMETLRRFIKKCIPVKLYSVLIPYYHFLLAWGSAVYYRHPSRSLCVIAVTGTKGKSTTTELIARILRAGGAKVASLSTIQFAIDTTVERNLYKMTMPGRSFVQHFLRRAVSAGCTYAVLEMTSEGAKQYRHRFIEIDALVFTNLTPEHIESHGSFQNYKAAKLSIAHAVAQSRKRPRYLVANTDSEHGMDFLNFPAEHHLPYRLADLTLYSLHKESVSLVIGETTLRVPLVGLFNVYNLLAAITMTRALGIPLTMIDKALRDLPGIAGRAERIEGSGGKPVTVIVDYAHTPDSLTQIYEAFKDQPLTCVLGNTGGGRDTWKRPEMGAIAERYCDHIILTNEDPYDEDPADIVHAMRNGMSAHASVEIILDRRAAIATAIEKAPAHGYVVITGKGTDPYIMGPQGTKVPWSDAGVVRELLTSISTPAATTDQPDTETNNHSYTTP
jgi:UDP-N-acetylmuramoyl-L-alanyl-D-glutamate--2,6-diaminopimelate ligase